MPALASLHQLRVLHVDAPFPSASLRLLQSLVQVHTLSLKSRVFVLDADILNLLQALPRLVSLSLHFINEGFTTRTLFIMGGLLPRLRFLRLSPPESLAAFLGVIKEKVPESPHPTAAVSAAAAPLPPFPRLEYLEVVQAHLRGPWARSRSSASSLLFFYRHVGVSLPLIYQTRAMEEQDVRAMKNEGAKSPILLLFLTIGFRRESEAKLLTSRWLRVSAAVMKAAAESQARRLRKGVPTLRRLRLTRPFHDFERHLEHTFEDLTLQGVHISNQRASDLLTRKSQCSLCQAHSR